MKDMNDNILSIEKFAAFLDGNLDSVEMDNISSMIKANEGLKSMVEASAFIDSDIKISNYDGPSEYWDLPELHTTDSILPEDIDNNLLTNITHTMPRIYGEGGQNIKDPIYIQQPDDHSCALRSQQIVLRDFGIDIPFKDLERIALDYGVYSDDGTYTCDIGKVLELAGVPMHQTIGNTVYDLTNELAQGHRIIVSVDAHELWYNDSLGGKLKNWFSDVFGGQGGNHALIVAGVEVNPDNPSDVRVVLTDPGAGDLRIEYPMEQFIDAWKDSGCFMAATDNAAPYQYDPNTGMEVPSNFFAEAHFNQWVSDNSYTLNPDKICVPDDYHPHFNGHLETVGHTEYSDFHVLFDKFESACVAAKAADIDIENIHAPSDDFRYTDNRLDHQVSNLLHDLHGLFHHNNSEFTETDTDNNVLGTEPIVEIDYNTAETFEHNEHIFPIE